MLRSKPFFLLKTSVFFYNHFQWLLHCGSHLSGPFRSCSVRLTYPWFSPSPSLCLSWPRIGSLCGPRAVVWIDFFYSPVVKLLAEGNSSLTFSFFPFSLFLTCSVQFYVTYRVGICRKRTNLSGNEDGMWPRLPARSDLKKIIKTKLTGNNFLCEIDSCHISSHNETLRSTAPHVRPPPPRRSRVARSYVSVDAFSPSLDNNVNKHISWNVNRKTCKITFRAESRRTAHLQLITTGVTNHERLFLQIYWRHDIPHSG